MHRRHVRHGCAVETILLLGPLSRAAMHSDGIKGCALVAHRLHEILHTLHGYVALKLQANVIRISLDADFAPAIFNDAPGLYGGHCKRASFYFKPADLDDGTLKNIFFLELHNRTVRLDRAGSDIFNLGLAAIEVAEGQVDLALRLPSAVGEYLHPDVVIEDQVALRIVINPDFPE